MPKKILIGIGVLAVLAVLAALWLLPRMGRIGSSGGMVPVGLSTGREELASGLTTESEAGSARSVVAQVASEQSRIEGVVMRGGKPEHDVVISYKPCGAGAVSEATIGHVNTNREGRFKFETSVRSRYQLDAFKDGIAPATKTADPGTFVTIELEYVATAGMIEGILLDSATHVPIDEFNLDVLRVRKGGWQSVLSKKIAHTGGVFRESLKLPDSSNELSVLFSAAGHRDKHVTCKDVARAAGVNLGEVLIDPVAGLAGTVVDDRDGTPVAGAKVRPVSTGGGHEEDLVTDGEGRFTIERMRGLEIIGIAASAVDFADAWFEVPPAVKDVAREPIVIRMTQGGEIRGRITSAKGLDLKDLAVGWWSEDGAHPAPGMPYLISDTVTPNSTGEYVLGHVPAKRVLVGLRRQGGSRETPVTRFEQLRWVECVVGESRTIDFQLDEGCSVRVLLAGKSRYGNALVVAKLLDVERMPISLIETRVGAAVEFTDVPRGRYVLRIEMSKVKWMEMDVDVLQSTVDLGEIDVVERTRR